MPKDDRARVYVVQASNGLLKFGHTRKLQKRFWAMQGLAPDPLRLVAFADGDKHVEQLLHSMLGASRHHGEWFSPTKQVLSAVASFERLARDFYLQRYSR